MKMTNSKRTMMGLSLTMDPRTEMSLKTAMVRKTVMNLKTETNSRRMILREMNLSHN